MNEVEFFCLTLTLSLSFLKEKGTTPLHVATRSSQRLQVELLLVYGADPTFPDAQGKTPIDYARYAKNTQSVRNDFYNFYCFRQHADKDLVNRLVESQYEVTDKFINYLTHRKPDHQNGIHFILPQAGYKSDASAMNRLKKVRGFLMFLLLKVSIKTLEIILKQFALVFLQRSNFHEKIP